MTFIFQKVIQKICFLLSYKQCTYLLILYGICQPHFSYKKRPNNKHKMLILHAFENLGI